MNLQDQEDKSPLLAIVEEENPNTEIMEFLIQQGANVNAKGINSTEKKIEKKNLKKKSEY